MSALGLAQGAFILDLGCGTGLAARALAMQGFRVTGLDVDLDAVETARTLCDEDAAVAASPEFLVARAEHVPFGDKVFDAVICLDVLHWAADEPMFRRMWSEAWRVLKPGGLFVARCRARADDSGDASTESVASVASRNPWFLPTRVVLDDLLARHRGAWRESPRPDGSPDLIRFAVIKPG